MYFDPVEFGKRMKAQRVAAGMNQNELAEKLGLTTKKHISGMERGAECCSIDLLVEISCVLHVSTDYLLMGKEPQRAAQKNQVLDVIKELTALAQNL